MSTLDVPLLSGSGWASLRDESAPLAMAAVDVPLTGPLSAEHAQIVLGQVLGFLLRAHEARVAGLRFRPTALAWSPGLPCRWLAPELPRRAGSEEAARQADLRDAAVFAWELLGADRPEAQLAWRAGEDAIVRAIACLESGAPNAALALRSALEALGETVPWPPRLPAATLFACRPWEIDELAVLAEGCFREGRTHVAAIAANSQIGLESLFEGLAGRVAAAGGRCLTVSCQGAASPGQPVAAAMRTLYEQLDLTPELTATLSPLSALLGELEPLETPWLSPAMARLRIFEATVALIEAASKEAPLCLLLLDFDRADGWTRTWVAHLRHHAPALPLLLCTATIGPEASAPDDALILAALAEDHLGQLAIQLCGGLALSESALYEAWRASQGDQSLLYRLCLRWLRGGALSPNAEGRYDPGEQCAESPLPERVLDVLQVMATFGGACDLLPLCQALGGTHDASFLAIDEALDGGWIRQVGERLSFVVRAEIEGCRAAMTPDERVACQARVAATLHDDPPAAATFSLHARLATLSVERLIDSARALVRRGADAEALSLLEGIFDQRAAEGPDGQALRLALARLQLTSRQPAGARATMSTAVIDALAGDEWALKGRIHCALGELEAADEALERARAHAGGVALLQVLMARAHAAHGAEHHHEALALAEEAHARALASGHDGWICASSLLLGQICLAFGPARLEQTLGLLYEAVRLGQVTGQLDLACEACRLLASSLRRAGNLAEAQARQYDHRDLCTYLGWEPNAYQASVALADLTIDLGQFEAALAEATRLESLLDEETYPALFARATASRALAALFLGNVHDPLRWLDQALRVAARVPDASVALEVRGRLASALLFLGKYARAEQVLREALASTPGPDTPRLLVLLAEWAWRTGDGAQSEQLLAEAEAEAEASWDQGLQILVLRGRARLALAAARFDVAAGAVRQAMDLALAGGQLFLQGELCWMLGEISRRQELGEAALTAFDAALSAADAMSSPHHRALALYGLSRCCEEPSQRQALRARAAESLDVFLDQLSGPAKRDFLNWDERRTIGDAPTSEPAPATPAAGLTMRIPQVPSHGANGLSEPARFLDEIFGLVTTRMSLDEMVHRINETFLRVSQSRRALLFLVNEDGELRLRDRQMATNRSGQQPSVQALDMACVPVLDRVLLTGQPVWVPDVMRDPILAHETDAARVGARGLLAIPLKVADGDGDRVIGCLYGDRIDPWLGLNDKDVELLDLMARYTSVIIEVGLLQDASASKAARLEMLNALSRALAGTLDLDRLLDLALDQILKVTRGEQGYVLFGQDLAPRAARDNHGERPAEVQLSRSVVARVQRERQPLAILDVGQDEELQQRASLMIRNVRSVMCVPLLLDDHLVGLIYISSHTANKTFTRHDLDLMTAISAQVALALQNAQAYETIKELNQGLEAKVKARTAELEAAYQELTETQAQLVETEKLASIGTLAGGVAHEINNPLGAILSNAQLMRLDINDAELLDSLDLIEAGAQRCREIVAALLRYSREAQNPLEALALGELLTETAESLRAAFEGRRARLEVALAAVGPVMGDAPELRRVLLNLLQNALDALVDRHGATGGTVRAELSQVPGGVSLAITDDGPGMGADVLKRIFDPFYTTKKVGSGTGLGLSVCQRIVEKHGGKISVRSQPGEGATFTLVLPVP